MLERQLAYVSFSISAMLCMPTCRTVNACGSCGSCGVRKGKALVSLILYWIPSTSLTERPMYGEPQVQVSYLCK
jgi:hypothetical protein